MAPEENWHAVAIRRCVRIDWSDSCHEQFARQVRMNLRTEAKPSTSTDTRATRARTDRYAGWRGVQAARATGSQRQVLEGTVHSPLLRSFGDVRVFPDSADALLSGGAGHLAPRSSPAEREAIVFAERATRGDATAFSGLGRAEVRVHTGAHATAATQRYGALAYTVGRDIVVNDGVRLLGTPEREQIFAHELAHVAATAPGVATRSSIQRAVAPEDISGEMKGETFEVVDAFASGAVQVLAGTSVIVSSWTNTAPTALVHLPYPSLNAGVDFNIPERLLRPTRPTAQLAAYGAGVTAQAASITRGEATIAKEQARAGGPRPGEIPRLEALQENRQRVLNRRLIQETMFNRLDPLIARWTDHYNPTVQVLWRRRA